MGGWVGKYPLQSMGLGGVFLVFSSGPPILSLGGGGGCWGGGGGAKYPLRSKGLGQRVCGGELGRGTIFEM